MVLLRLSAALAGILVRIRLVQVLEQGLLVIPDESFDIFVTLFVLVALRH